MNLYQPGNFMHKFQKFQVSKIFNMAFENSTHEYPTQFSETNSEYKKYSLTSTKHSLERPKIWN